MTCCTTQTSPNIKPRTVHSIKTCPPMRHLLKTLKRLFQKQIFVGGTMQSVSWQQNWYLNEWPQTRAATANFKIDDELISPPGKQQFACRLQLCSFVLADSIHKIWPSQSQSRMPCTMCLAYRAMCWEGKNEGTKTKRLSRLVPKE